MFAHAGRGLLELGLDRPEAAIAHLLAHPRDRGACRHRRAQLRAVHARPDREPDPGRAGGRGAQHAGRVRGRRRSGPAAAGRSPPPRAAAGCSRRPRRPTRSSPTRSELAAAEPSPFERARTELCWGERLRRDGRRVDARRHLHDALERFEALGAEPWAAKAVRELRSSGGRAQRGPRARSDELTPQQMQIAAMVAEGTDEPEHRGLAVPEPEDDRVPPRPRLPQARREQPHRAHPRAADLLRRLTH